MEQAVDSPKQED